MYQSDFPSQFAQLQSRYPMSSLITEFVQVHDGQVIVRATVQVNGAAIATSMATAPTVEQAEDQARLRILSFLGITPTDAGLSTPTSVLSPSNGFSGLPPLSTPTWLEPEPAIAPLVPIASNSYESLPEIVEDDRTADALDFVPDDLLDESLDKQVDQVEYHSPLNEPFEPEFEAPLIEEPEPVAAMPDLNGDRAANRNATKPKKALKEVTTPTAEAGVEEPTTPEPDDLSSLIAMTDIEMDRIGWTKQEGREYLKRTYKKSTRQRLDVDELMDFLNYLRALPSLNGL